AGYPPLPPFPTRRSSDLHPDIQEFIWCKAHEEEKARVLEAAGYDMSLDSPDWASIQYQNANNSVRVSDAFMAAAEADADWNLTRSEEHTSELQSPDHLVC